MPSIGKQFGESTASLDSVVIGFLVSLAVFIPAAGWLGDRFGMKRMLLLAILLFTGASVLCGTAGSLSQLVVYRVVQGVGGGMLTPVGMAMLFRTFPPAERVRASSILTVPTAVAPAVGPVLGGLLVTQLSWRWVFFVNLPIGILAMLFGIFFLEEQREPVKGRFDVPGFVLSGGGFALLMYGVSAAPVKGWGSPVILGAIALGAVMIGAMIVVELRTAAPLLHIRLFTNRLFRSCSLVLVMAVSSFLGVLFVVPLFFQLALGLTALQSGLNTFPEAIGIMIGAQFASRFFYPRFGPRRLMSGGLVGVAVAIALMTRIGVTTDLWWMRLLMFAMGLAMSQVFISSQAASFATITHAETGPGLLAVQQPAAAGERGGGGPPDHGAGPGGHRARGGRPSGPRPGRLPRRLPDGGRPGPGRLVGGPHRPRRRRRRHHGPARVPASAPAGRADRAPRPAPAG